MIIKQPDGRSSDLATLRGILARDGLDPGIRTAAEQEVYRIERGLEGESESRRQIDFYFGASKYWAVLHDLRIDLGQGRVAQIDHLLINRFLQFWVCESKFKTGTLSVNEHGEFSVLTAQGPIGIPSPIEQSWRQVSVLEDVLQRLVKMPRSFGIRIEPLVSSLVLVSTNTIIQRPTAKFEGSECLIKNDAIRTATSRQWKLNTAVFVAKALYWWADRFVRSATLERVAKQLADLHRPVAYDWDSKLAYSLGLAASSGPTDICAKCGDTITPAEAKFCLGKQARFGGRMYCFSDQKEFGGTRQG